MTQEQLATLCAAFGISANQLGVIIVDHGSRRADSNEALLKVVELFSQLTPYELVEPAHMELAEPSISTAFERLVSRGAVAIAVHPYLLSPGRHWAEDIPALTKAAAIRHQGVRYLVTAPLGIHHLIATVMDERIQHCLQHALGQVAECEVCRNPHRCQLS